MSEDGKQYWKLLAGVAALGLASLACAGVFQGAQEFDCEASGGHWRYNSHFNDYYCENAGPDYMQKYSPTATPIASPVLETSPSNTQETSPTGITPPIIEPSPTDPDSPTIAGLWHGTAQWLCDTNPIWSTSLEFKSDGMVHATLSTTTDTANADGSWQVKGDEISMQFERGLWIGTISGNTISGTFAEENCNGVWSVSKD
jgi:hypothetical protein